LIGILLLKDPFGKVEVLLLEVLTFVEATILELLKVAALLLYYSFYKYLKGEGDYYAES
jgi:hypothetical protein